MMYWLESTTNKVEAHAVIAAEFMVMGHKAFSKDSVCIFSTRSGNTKEIVAAAKFCKEAGARTMVYVSNDNTPSANMPIINSTARQKTPICARRSTPTPSACSADS